MIMRARYVAVALATLVLGPTRASAQQQFNWDQLCTLGTQQLCFSVNLGIIPGIGGTAFDITLRNLEGTLGTTPFAMWDVSFWNLATDLGDGFAVPTRQATLNGTAGFVVTDPNSPVCLNVGCPNAFWGDTEWDWLVNSGRGTLQETIDALPKPVAIVGCDVPQAFNQALGYFQTCGNGSISYSFVLPGIWSFDGQSSATFAYRTAEISPGSGCVAVTNTARDIANGCLPVTSTPEPATLALMATGLFSVAGLARRRRRRA